MASNTLTDIIPNMMEAMDTVSRELTGMLPAITMDARASQAAKGQTVRTNIEPDYAAGSTITPAMSVPETEGETSGYVDVVMSNAKAYSFGLKGEEEKGLNNGIGANAVITNKMAQRIRRLVNDVETDLANLHITTSRAYGTAAVTPFATANDFTDATFAKKILLDNGAPDFDNHLVLNTTAGATLAGKQAAANVQGSDSILRQGVLLPLSGLDLRQSAQIVTNTKGTGTGYLVNSAALAIGDIIIPSDTGTGTILAGDIVTFAGDTNKYVVATALSAGSFTIGAPGLLEAPADNAAITVVGNAARNMVFNRGAIVLAARAPERPARGDQATDVQVFTDPRSGLSYELAVYPGYHQERFEIGLVWGVKNIKPEHTGLLLG